MRSVWKGNILKQHGNIFFGNSTVLSSLFEKKILMYDGKQLKSFVITRGMLGLKVGEFVLTRKFGKLHKEKKISKKIKK